MSEALVLETHLFWKPEGVGSSRTTKATFADGDEVGIVESCSLDQQVEEEVIEKPDPGQRVDWDVITIKRSLLFSLVMKEVSPLFWELLMGTAALTAGATAAYTPLSTAGTKKGWVKLTQYDAFDVLKNTVEIYAGGVKVDKAEFGKRAQVWTISGRVLKSAVAAGTLTALA